MSEEQRANELVILMMEDHQGRPLRSEPMKRWVAEQVVSYVSPSGHWDGTAIRSLKIVPLGMVKG